MSNKNKVIPILLVATLSGSLLAGCGAHNGAVDNVTGTVDGATADIGMYTNNALMDTLLPLGGSPSESYKSDSEDYIEEWNTEEYDSIQENRFLAVKNNPLSTFAADVDTASYANLRRYVLDGGLPPVGSIRTEELLNYFKYNYSLPSDGEPFSCNTEVIPCPWNPDTLLLQIGLATAPVDKSDMPAQNLVFLLDVSGSMSDDLDLVKNSFKLLCDQLNPDDTISIVTYANGDEVVLEGAHGDELDLIMSAIEDLDAGGGTNGSEGIITAYEIAERNFIDGGNNRIILATDGDLNIGTTSESELEKLVSNKKKSGVYLSVLGFGSGNLKDNKLETLADKGNGNYSYIDSILEARKALIKDIGGTLLTVADDVKLQVEFNPNTIKGYRLIGYENRLLNDEDFNDDSVDGGEIGAGHRVTVLYELVPIDSDIEIPGIDLKYQDTDASNSGDTEFCTVSVRAKKPGRSKSDLWEYPVDNEINTGELSDNIKLASAIAELGMLLNESEFSGDSSYESISNMLSSMTSKDALVEELSYLVRQLSRL